MSSAYATDARDYEPADIIARAKDDGALAAIAEACGVLLAPGEVHEVRIPGTRRGTVSGYFDDHRQLVDAAASWDGKAPGIYVTINPCNPDLLARAVNRLQPYAKEATKDPNILRRRWLPIDCDPVRPAGIGSTDPQHVAALQRAEKIRSFLTDLGFPSGAFVMADSGNGAHVNVRLELPNDAEATELVQRSLSALALFFDDDAVKVDQTTSNAARIWKLYGTLAAKGDNTRERPHRRARLLDFRPNPPIVERDLLEKLARLVPRPDRTTPHNGTSFNLSSWIERHALPVVATGPWQSGQRWVLNPCPWNPEHNNGAAFIVQFGDGGIAAGCHHNGCHGKRWADLRALYEPSRPASGTAATNAGPSTSARSLDEVIATYQRWQHLPDVAPLLVVLGAVAANRMPGDPVWLLVVGPPGGGKTELLNSLMSLPQMHLVGTITEAALLSGTPNREKAATARGGLLREIGDFGFIIAKDFTSVLSMHRDARGAVLAALREIFDGRWTRRIGTDGGKELTWSGKLALLAGCTPTIDSHHAVMAAMGERFVFCRLPVIDDTAQGLRALEHVGREAEMRQELSEAVAGLFAAVVIPSDSVALSRQDRTRLVALASLAVKCRSAVERDSYRREIELVPDAEAPARLALTLARLLAGMQVIGVQAAEAWRVITKCALDSMPQLRRGVFELLRAETAPLDTTTVAERTKYPTVTARRACEDLAAHGVAIRHPGGDGKADKWTLSDWARRRYEAAVTTFSETSGGVSGEGVSEKSGAESCLPYNTFTVNDDKTEKVPEAEQ